MRRPASRDRALEPPGAYRPPRDVWGDFASLMPTLPSPAFALVDRRVSRLHPQVGRALRAARIPLLELRAGESAKSLRSLERVAAATLALPRSGTLLCVGGGTLGDLGTVAAHLVKRGVSLVHVPTTLLAAVDSSVGGKGAVHAGSRRTPVKNALGVFHYADACWICPELFSTLSPRQLREGRIEAWKMAATLSAPLWDAWSRRAPPLERLIREARALKAAVCAKDPYERLGDRRVLNFGHTFGHVLESATSFRVSHGDAVGLGMLCALDLGRALSATPPRVAGKLEEGLHERAEVLPRSHLASALRGAGDAQVAALLAADKKSDATGELQVVLADAIGHAIVRPAPAHAWRLLLRAWRRGVRP